MKTDRPVPPSWLFLMAWRDSRRNRSRLALFISSVVLGIAALVATLSFGSDLRTAIDDQAKMMVGADLVIRGDRDRPRNILTEADYRPGKHAMEYSMTSMISFIKSGGSRLIQVRALEGAYPFYGGLETTPVQAGRSFRNENRMSLFGRNALVDKTLMLQYGARVGDSVRIGTLNFAITGILNKALGRTELSTTIAPPVYIPLRYADQAGLLQKGSRVECYVYYKFDSLTDIDRLVDTIAPRLEQNGLRYETVETWKNRTSRSFKDFTQFLALISFVALLLGCIGVASSIHVYIREKIDGIAVLRCLGVKARHAFLIYLIQIAGIGLIGSIAGVAVGLLAQQALPTVFKDFLPMETTMHISGAAIAQGLMVGLTLSILFALLPLLSIRSISPLHTLRRSFEPPPPGLDPLKGSIYAVIFLFVTFFSAQQMHNWRKALVFTIGLLIAFLLLAGIARLLMWSVRHFFRDSWNYLWRQGFGNLYRPNNQTLVLIVTIGLSTAFIGTLYFVQQMLVDRISFFSGKSQGNMVLFDIQNDQLKGVEDLARRYQVVVHQDIPLINMRIQQIKKQTPDRQGIDTMDRIGRRISREEARVTYRDTLTSSEKLLAGELGPPVRSPKDPIHISLDEHYAGDLHLTIGDTIIFNVQGLLVTTLIGSLKQTEPRRLDINFRIVFPTGVLEKAPQFHILIVRIPTVEVSAGFQQEAIRDFPNVSVIDMSLVLSVLDDILEKIGFVIRFMAAFIILTGLIVLIASVLISKYQRIQEIVLLRTLGARRRQILIIVTLEYFFLGALAAGTGLLLSLPASALLAKYSFDGHFSPHWGFVALLFLLVSLLTVSLGLLNSRSVLNRPPLEILRNEV